MLRALLDTNVLISAAVHPSGLPGKIVFSLVSRQAFDLVISPRIVAEVEQTFEQKRIRKYLRDPKEAHLWLADIVAIADVVDDTGRVVGICRDPGDDMVLAAAIEGRADVIVTGDLDLLSLEEYESIAIVTPRAFQNLLVE